MWVQALPTTKRHFEVFASATDGFDNAWYEASQIAPAARSSVAWRASARTADRRDYEGIFVGGLRCHEAVQFAAWVDERAELPTLDLWRALYEHTRQQPASIQQLCQNAECPQKGLIEQLARATTPRTLSEAMLMENGLLEWVMLPTWRGPTWRLVGRPRHDLLPQAFSPVDNPIDPVPGARVRAAGVRLVVRGSP